MNAVEKGFRLNTKAIREQLEKMAEKAGGKLIVFKLYSDHPSDSFLYLVLVELKAEFNGEPYPKFVTWLANLDCGGFHGGHYFESPFNHSTRDEILNQAKADWNKRGYRTTI